ncbi:hypothetical protein SAMN02745172_03671 [Pseudoxanthobacter soli DSM 19599]|uniref:Uncharacterized protein n=1 Tax=Pseudoxanthobacter soli DSM 19599 TaxID=1123029 RepID=A0A1M7ZQC2_9HYPH|nr:hypothetical protein [Pseudoxanthobacter soli]SHO67009.1 hypothetical protein SAMN02745172_03671 [Pseudoxanthobacter soli DSM 19599]
MKSSRKGPCRVLCGARQDDDLALPAYGRFERIQWSYSMDGTFKTPLRFTGLLDLSGPHAMAHLDYPVWAVVELDAEDPCEPTVDMDGAAIPGLLSFGSGFVLFRGARMAALSVFAAGENDASLKTPLSAIQDRSGVALAGDFGTATAGHEGLARAGFCGLAEAGMPDPEPSQRYADLSGLDIAGVAIAGVRGTALSGVEGLSIVEGGGTARAGDGGVAIATSFSPFSTVVAGHGGAAILGGTGGNVSGGIAVSTHGCRFLEVQLGGIGVAQYAAENLEIGEDALMIATALGPKAVIHLGKQATLIFREDSDEPEFTVFSSLSGNVEPGLYRYANGQFRQIDGMMGPGNIWESERLEPRSASSMPPPPTFDIGVEWWAAARSHDPQAQILREPVREDDIVVLCANIPAEDLAAGRKDGQWWFGAPWGRGELALTDGALCCLVRVEGEHEPHPGGGEQIGFRNGSALYRGTLRGAVAALRAFGAASVLDGHVAVAGHGGVARVSSRRDPVPAMGTWGERSVVLPELGEEIPFPVAPHAVLRGDPNRGCSPSLAVAGNEGVAICDGEAHAGERGVAWVAGLGVARAGSRGLAICEQGLALAGGQGIALNLPARIGGGEESQGGQAVAGLGGIAIARGVGSSAISGGRGVAIAMNVGRARTGNSGVAICRATGDAHGGASSVVVAQKGRVSGHDRALLVAWDKSENRWVHAVVGQGGIEPGVPYAARNGRLEPAPKPFLTEIRGKRWQEPD